MAAKMVLTIIFTCLASPTAAQESSPCVNRADFLKQARDAYDVTIMGRDIDALGNVIEMLVEPGGDWVKIRTGLSGCVVIEDYGTLWEPAPAAHAAGPST